MYRGILLFCVFAGAVSSLELKPCRREDAACLNRLANHFFVESVKGDPFRGIETLDPMYQEYIEGQFTAITYRLYNSTLKGFQECHIANTKLSLEKNTMNVEFDCPYFEMTGSYNMSGILILVPIEGNGLYTLICKGYRIFVDTEIKTTEAKDGKRYLQFQKFKVGGDLRDGMHVDMTNLFNGKYPDLANAAIKFANDYWKPVARELQGPIFYANIRRLIRNMNRFMKNVPLDKLIVY